VGLKHGCEEVLRAFGLGWLGPRRFMRDGYGWVTTVNEEISDG
jgi:hypothetical protein